jgi:hypothetical protein
MSLNFRILQSLVTKIFLPVQFPVGDYFKFDLNEIKVPQGLM